MMATRRKRKRKMRRRRKMVIVVARCSARPYASAARAVRSIRPASTVWIRSSFPRMMRPRSRPKRPGTKMEDVLALALVVPPRLGHPVPARRPLPSQELVTLPE
uniref:Putative secreted peptide n=1 Tax=Anopheles braziliensis TaxID=58242 RepID=A0A2M3ZR24_9DIPT